MIGVGLLWSCAVAWPDEPEPTLIAVIVEATGPQERRAPPGTALPIQGEPAAVAVRIAELGRARPVVTRMLGGGPGAIRVAWDTGDAKGERWIVAGNPAIVSNDAITVGFGDPATVTVHKGAGFEACAPACVPLLPGRPTPLPGVTLTLEDWLPNSEERHVGAPDPQGERAARLEVLAPEGTRSVWLLVDDPASHLTLGNARLWVRTAR